MINLKNQDTKIKSFLFLVLLSFCGFGQDSIQLKSSENEEKNIKFQELFFKALSEKAKNEPLKAIEALDECNSLIPNNKAVLFELSKNFYSLNRTFEALQYANLALKQEAKNIWLLEHLVKIHKRRNTFDEAIKVQEQIAADFPKKKRALVYLHLQNNDITSAKNVLAELKKEKLLNRRLRRIDEKLNNPTKINTIEKKPEPIVASTSKGSLKEQFTKEKTYVVLESLLNELYKNNDKDLLTFSEQGLSLFPAQPLVYLMSGRALINNNEHKKAIVSLQNGIDFVIDNPTMEANFYKALITAYKKLGDRKNSSKFQKKLNAL